MLCVAAEGETLLGAIEGYGEQAADQAEVFAELDLVALLLCAFLLPEGMSSSGYWHELGGQDGGGQAA